jgi:hypothetical protein
MKVFISWSGEPSKRVAELLHDWLPHLMQHASPWVSVHDIQKGSMWFGEIGEQMAMTGFGILCLTRSNLDAPWILFEAGALWKGLPNGRVCPLLIDLGCSDLKPPLSHFNATLLTEDDVFKLVTTINDSTVPPEKPVSKERLLVAFNKWWPDFQGKQLAIIASTPKVEKGGNAVSRAISNAAKTLEPGLSEEEEKILVLLSKGGAHAHAVASSGITSKLKADYFLPKLARASFIRVNHNSTVGAVYELAHKGRGYLIEHKLVD